MTVNVQIPYVSLLGDGEITRFAFPFGLVETYDLYVKVNGEIMVEYSDYTVENIVDDDGGDVVFAEPPDDGAVVIIFRDTTKSQQLDYVNTQAFPAETHEEMLDKIIYILQELIFGTFNGIGDDGEPFQLSFDLSVTQEEITMTVVNSGGTDAVLPMWENATLAGVYAGEVVPLDVNMPADESVTTKPNGYIWLGTENGT